MSYSIYRGPTILAAPLYQPGEASEEMLPGHVVVKSGDDLDLGAANSVGVLLIAKENMAGKEGTVIDATFEIGDSVDAYKARQGQVFDVRFPTGVALVKGETLLERRDSGQLGALTSGVAIATAYETVTTTANDQLVTVEIL